MISYLQAARELDARWTGSLQFLPPTPTLRNECDCIAARQIAATEIDLFNRYAGEIAAANGLKLDRLLDLYDWLLMTGKLSALDGDDRRMDGRTATRRLLHSFAVSVRAEPTEVQIAGDTSSSGMNRSKFNRS